MPDPASNLPLQIALAAIVLATAVVAWIKSRAGNVGLESGRHTRQDVAKVESQAQQAKAALARVEEQAKVALADVAKAALAEVERLKVVAVAQMLKSQDELSVRVGSISERVARIEGELERRDAE